MRTIFFYGLFMDRSLLAGQGLQPEVVGRAVLPDFRIHIGQRATLIRSAGSRAYGVVMTLPDHEAEALYAEPSVREYVPERVRVELLNTGEELEADCYNLPPEVGLAGTNPAYATQLSRLVEALEFDPDYVAEIAAFGEPS
ncbi:MAG: gamma-glutamylcyclotransferase [Gemmatimonadetes bacterium]|nr:gamma-glutamylcyclotransferase [Gemmatimonadota bacterium]